MEITDILKKRSRESHKGTFGQAMLVAGSKGMMGAALLSARACMRSGLGLLTVYTADCGYDILQLGIPEAKCQTDPCHTHITQIPSPGDNLTAVGIGPGLGKHPNTGGALHEYLLQISAMPSPPRLVIDADGLNLLAENPSWLRLLPENTVLTPHPGEWKRLQEAVCSLEDAAQELSERNMILVLKDTYTQVVERPLFTVSFIGTTARSWANTQHGHSGMAVGGTGDALTGIILALLAQGYEPFEAATLGVYIHSLAADLALKTQSHESWLPSDLIASLGPAFNHLRSRK